MVPLQGNYSNLMQYYSLFKLTLRYHIRPRHTCHSPGTMHMYVTHIRTYTLDLLCMLIYTDDHDCLITQHTYVHTTLSSLYSTCTYVRTHVRTASERCLKTPTHNRINYRSCMHPYNSKDRSNGMAYAPKLS